MMKKLKSDAEQQGNNWFKIFVALKQRTHIKLSGEKQGNNRINI
jgi:hypothetical protein